LPQPESTDTVERGRRPILNSTAALSTPQLRTKTATTRTEQPVWDPRDIGRRNRQADPTPIDHRKATMKRLLELTDRKMMNANA